MKTRDLAAQVGAKFEIIPFNIPKKQRLLPFWPCYVFGVFAPRGRKKLHAGVFLLTFLQTAERSDPNNRLRGC